MSQTTLTPTTREQDLTVTSTGNEESSTEREISKIGLARVSIFNALEELGIERVTFERPGCSCSGFDLKYDEELVRNYKEQGNVRSLEFHQKLDEINKRIDAATTLEERDQIRDEYNKFIAPIRNTIEWLALWVEREVVKEPGCLELASVDFDVKNRRISLWCDATCLMN